MSVSVTPLSLKVLAVRETVLPVHRRHLVDAATYRRISQTRSEAVGLALFIIQCAHVSICPEYVENLKPSYSGNSVPLKSSLHHQFIIIQPPNEPIEVASGRRIATGVV